MAVFANWWGRTIRSRSRRDQAGCGTHQVLVGVGAQPATPCAASSVCKNSVDFPSDLLVGAPLPSQGAFPRFMHVVDESRVHRGAHEELVESIARALVTIRRKST